MMKALAEESAQAASKAAQKDSQPKQDDGSKIAETKAEQKQTAVKLDELPYLPMQLIMKHLNAEDRQKLSDVIGGNTQQPPRP